MAIINKGTAFSNGEQLSASKLNDLVDGATFGTDSVDNSTTLVNANGAITVRDSGITAAKLATGAVTTAKIADANVTFAKLDDVIDDDTMATATATTLATSESIKAYVDGGFTPSTYAGGESVTLPNGLIMKWGKLNPSTGNNTVTYGTAFPTATVNVQYARFKALPYSAYDDNNAVTSESASGFDIYVATSSTYGTVAWQAIGY